MTKDCQIPLTARELQIAELITTGSTAKGIARKLYISENTVKFHRKNIYKKLGVNNKLELLSQLK